MEMHRDRIGQSSYAGTATHRGGLSTSRRHPAPSPSPSVRTETPQVLDVATTNAPRSEPQKYAIGAAIALGFFAVISTGLVHPALPGLIMLAGILYAAKRADRPRSNIGYPVQK